MILYLLKRERKDKRMEALLLFLNLLVDIAIYGALTNGGKDEEDN